MADIAKIGFAVETAQLEKGVASLNKLSTASKSANASAQAIGSSMTTAAKTFAGAVAGMSKSVHALVSATKSSTVEQIAAAKEAMDFANNIYKAANAQDKLANSVNKVTKSVNSQILSFSRLPKILYKSGIYEPTAMQKRIDMLTGVGRSFAGDSMAEMTEAFVNEKYLNQHTSKMMSRFNTSNIAAQFQDIAVTAAMGMNPLTVALQQGTQLASVLNLMEKPLEGIAQAFKSLINPISLISIGLTALVVVGLQVVDWGKVGVSTMDALAGAFDFVAQNADKFAVVLTGIALTVTALKFNAIITGLSSVSIKIIEATVNFGKLIAQKTGMALLAAATWALKNPVLAVSAAILGGVTAWAMFSEEGKNALNKTIGYAIAAAYSIGGAMEALFKSTYKGKDAWNELKNDLSDLVNKDYVGELEKGVKTLGEKGVESFNALKQKIIENTDAFKKAQEESDKLQKSWEKLLATAQQDTKDVEFELKVAGKDTWDETYMRTMYELEKQTKQEGIILDRTKLDLIKQEASDRANATVALENYNDEIELQKEIIGEVKDVTKGFFQDLRDGLQEGKSGWEAFGDAALNVLDKILDKMMDLAVEALIDSISGSSGGGGGFMSNFINTMIGSSMGGGSGDGQFFNFSAAETSAMSSAAQASGQVTMINGSYLGPFAKGGVFSNGVVDSPTLFKFAKGGQFGVMGEAGPEAVMPLSRGPDGSLGVRMDSASSSQSPVIVNVINNSDSQARTEERQTEHGLEIDVIIDKMVAEKMGRPGTASNTALKAYNSQSLIQR